LAYLFASYIAHIFPLLSSPCLVHNAQGGEALQVVDTNEAWVFHMLADDTGASAVWAAQRVPDGHLAAVANQFIIRTVRGGKGGEAEEGSMRAVRNFGC